MSEPHLEHARREAEAAAREAGEELLRRYRPTGQETVRTKGRARDLVTDADGASEAVILRRLRAAFPDDAFMAEETAPEAVRGGRVWVIDPLDGTVNYAHGIPVFSVSIGLVVDGEPVVGVVHAPRLGETWTAARGGGATLDGEPVTVSERADLGRALLATGFAYRRNETRANNLDNFAHLALRTRGVRRLGSAAIDLAFTACGRYDGFWELWLSPWDVCAGVALVREAGGAVTGIGGAGDPVFGDAILATNGRIHAALDAELTGTERDGAPDEGRSPSREA